MSRRMNIKSRVIVLFAVSGVTLTMCAATLGKVVRQGRPRLPAAPPTLGLEVGTLDFDTPDFKLKLVKASQTVAALEPKGADGFDFTPADRLQARAANGFNHLGDITLRYRKG